MSATSTPADSPVGTPIQPLHNPAQAAKVVVPKAPLNKNVVNDPEMGAKALLAKRMAKSHNPAFISPTDNLMTPVTQKLAAAKKKQFTKGTKPVQLFATQPQAQSSDAGEAEDSDDEKMDEAPSSSQPPTALANDDENPF